MALSTDVLTTYAKIDETKTDQLLLEGDICKPEKDRRVR